MQYPDRFSDLPAYAFPRLRALLDAHAPGAEPVHMSIGEPRHPFPHWLSDAIAAAAAGFARYPPNEGAPELLDAVAAMSPRPVTQLAGEILLERDAPYREALEARAAELGDRVSLLGAVPYLRVADLMRRTKVLVNTSRTGSVDKVVLEAMACGTVPLTCNESFRDLLGPDLSERLMFPRDEPRRLARALEELLALPVQARTELGARLRAIVQERHDVRRLIPRLVAEMEPGR